MKFKLEIDCDALEKPGTRNRALARVFNGLRRSFKHLADKNTSGMVFDRDGEEVGTWETKRTVRE